MIRSLARLALLLWAVVPVVLAGVLLAQHPFAKPIVERSASEARQALTLAMADAVTPGWLVPRMESALQAKDMPRLRFLDELAADHGVQLPPDLRTRVSELLAKQDRLMARLGNCALCMADINACPSVSLMLGCTVPFELSPAGDGAALVRQGWNWLSGDEIDELEAALAGLGLVATAATVASLGGGAPAKAGLTSLRIANRTGALSPGLRRSILLAARNKGEILDIGRDVGRVAKANSFGDALAITRLADDGADLKRLARLSEVAGKTARPALEVLGKPRTLRLLHRVSDLAVATLGLLGLIFAQVCSLLLAALKLMLQRAMAEPRGPVRRIDPVPPAARSPARSLRPR